MTPGWRRDVVVSPHRLATEAGLEIFAAGGSAVEAAIAVNAVLGVVAPETCGVGGDLFALVWEEGYEKPATLNASGPAGSGADPGELAGLSAIPLDHPLSVTVPGCVAGWEALSTRFGRLDWGQLIAPAIRLAEDGFEVFTELAAALAAKQDILASQPTGAEFYPDGSPAAGGDRIRRPRLAGTLREIVEAGADGFYQGPAGAAISGAVDGRITPSDLAGFAPEWVEPARCDVAGLSGWTVPPNSQGYLTLATLAVFEQLEPGSGPDSADWNHLLIEAYRSVAWERDDMVSDPVTAPNGWEVLLDPSRLAARAGLIDRRWAGLWPPPSPALGGTAYMCALGGDGQGISLIQSNFTGFGSGIGAGEAGFLLQNRGAGFDLRPGHPNRLTPGRRPLHTLSPTLWTDRGWLRALLGTRGGDQQPQILAQMAARLFLAGETPAVAQDGPRWTMEATDPTVRLEARASDEVAAGLEDRGHRVVVGSPREPGWGPVAVITVDPSGHPTGAADPRVETASAATS